MVLGERIKDPLNHKVRYILLNIILKYKRTGIRLRELSRITGKKNHSLRHHLDILENKRLVYTKRYTNQLYYYPDSHIPKHTRIGHPLENKIRSKMLEAILDGENKGIQIGALHKKLKISKNRSLRAIKILKYFELVNIEKSGDSIYCYPTPKTLDLVKYIKEKINLFETMKNEEGILIKDFKNNLDLTSLNFFKLCVYTKRHRRDAHYHLTPFVEFLLDKNNSVG